ncbi:glycoside hydrolase superfamily [Cladochytrium replicatum]|nr:glycoside hydrolase superfamily [Cladochytrium replicatum]
MGSPSPESPHVVLEVSSIPGGEHAGSTPSDAFPTLTALAGLGQLVLDGVHFRDVVSKRTVLLRGVNLSGNAKLPARPSIPSHESDNFFDDHNVSFVGRPFPLEEADEHLSRLRHWGFNFLRLNITWEALEHDGPGKYDYEFMNYLVAVLYKLKQYGFKCFIDPHQDVWSRFSGGSGAPGWTLRAAGLDPQHFAATNAALVHNTYPEPSHFPKMIWATNYFKLACATMFALFFAGNIFAPDCFVPVIDESTNTTKKIPIQDFLQQHYVNAIVALARHIHDNAPDLEGTVVVGYDTLNEPSESWIGLKDISRIAHTQNLKHGLTPTPFQAMLLGEGHAAEVETWAITSMGPAKRGSQLVNPNGISAWMAQRYGPESDFGRLSTDGASEPGGCIWANHGVWDRRTRQIVKPDYFASNPRTGERVYFYEHCFIPFVKHFADAIRAVVPDATIFVEPPVNEVPPKLTRKNNGGKEWENIVYAPHWYDGLTLINKHYNPWFNVDVYGIQRGKYLAGPVQALALGESAIRRVFRDTLRSMKDEGIQYIGKYPCLIGEIGIPFDLDDRIAYITNDYTEHKRALDASMQALEHSVLNFTLWTYCPNNTHAWGDGWNGEDLSLWSRVAPTHSTKNEDHSKALNGDDTASTSGSWKTAVSERESLEMTGHIPADLDLGGRATESFVRPTPMMVPGITLHATFEPASTLFTFVFRHATPAYISANGKQSAMDTLGASLMSTWDTPGGEKEVEIYLPRMHYGSSEEVEVWVSSPSAKIYTFDNGEGEAGGLRIDLDSQRLFYRCDCLGGAGHTHRTTPHPVVEHSIVVRRRKKGDAGGLVPLDELAPIEVERRKSGEKGEGRLCPEYCSVM